MNMMTMRPVPDGTGGYRHIPTPFVPTTPAKRGRKRLVPDPIKTNGESAAEQLRLLIERVERLEEEEQAIRDDKKEVFGEAKATGFDTKAMKTVIALRKQEKHTREENEMILETYLTSLGLA